MYSSQYNSKPVVQAGPCSYGSLSNYYGERGLHLPVPPLPKGQVAGTYVVPVYNPPGYSTLVHGNGCCAGYPDIRSAYRSDGSCNPQYNRMHCG